MGEAPCGLIGAVGGSGTRFSTRARSRGHEERDRGARENAKSVTVAQMLGSDAAAVDAALAARRLALRGGGSERQSCYASQACCYA